MTFRRVVVSQAAIWALFACSNDDTVIALNVSSSDAVPVVDRLHVKITQGSREYVRDFSPPIETPSGEDAPPPSIKNGFFERLTLPEGWSEEAALVSVEAQQADGSGFDPPIRDETSVTLRPDGVVAAYIELDVPAAPPSGEGGAGGSGDAGEAGAGGVPTAGGAAAAGGVPAGAGEAGSGGAAGGDVSAGAGGT